MMPQKRNAFLLEHVQGRSALPLGAFTGAAAAMQAKPFTNSIAVGTEGVTAVWDALRCLAEAAALLRLTVAGACPVPAAMEAAATSSHTAATELANRVMRDAGLAFRDAHRQVGALVTEAEERGEPLAAAAARWTAREGLAVDLEALDPASIARASEFGGGPGPRSLAACLCELRADWRRSAAALGGLVAVWAAAEHELEAVAGRLAQEISPRLEGVCRSGSNDVAAVPD
jgi:argininosuccinate lyase